MYSLMQMLYAASGEELNPKLIKTPAVALEVEAPEEEGEEESEQMAEQIISQYGQFSSSREMDPRLGLVLFFGGILGFLTLTIFLFYWFRYR